MALIQCAGCEQTISSVASACIHCGAAMPGANAKPVAAAELEPGGMMVMDESLLSMHGLSDPALLNELNEALASMQAPTLHPSIASHTSSTQTYGPGDDIPASVQAMTNAALESVRLAGGKSSERTYEVGDEVPAHLLTLASAGLESAIQANGNPGSAGTGGGLTPEILSAVSFSLAEVAANAAKSADKSGSAGVGTIHTGTAPIPAPAPSVSFSMDDVIGAVALADIPEVAAVAPLQASAAQIPLPLPLPPTSFSMDEVAAAPKPADTPEIAIVAPLQASAVQIPLPVPAVSVPSAPAPASITDAGVAVDPPEVAVAAPAPTRLVQKPLPTPPDNFSLPAVAAPAQTVDSSDALGNQRPVPLWLGLAIFLLPPVFVWFLLRKGHTTTQRVLGFSWMGLMALGKYASTLAGS